MNDIMRNVLEIKDEVKEAMMNKMPVVALESTIITHGMPYPENVKTALEVEQIIRSHGAVPATIAIMNGIIKVGLSADEIEELAKEKNVVKVSRRDLPTVLAKKITWGNNRCRNHDHCTNGWHKGVCHRRDRGRSSRGC